VEETPDSFTVRYRALCEGAGGERLNYRASITGTANGVAFEAEATPEGDFLTNRCGFSILHPVVGLAGSPVEIEHVDGAIEHSVLPALIDPAQPFMQMRAISHQVAPGVCATCRMEGDAFEMEDQRNWSDASFKTYVRPLALPWPYTLPAGEPQAQSVTLTIDVAGDASAPVARGANEPVRISLGDIVGTLPRFGLILTPEEAAATLKHGDRLKELAPQTLLCHFDLTSGHGLKALRAFRDIAQLHPAELVLECVVPCMAPVDEEMAHIARLVREVGLKLDAIAVSPAVDRKSTPPGSKWPDCPPLEEVYAATRRAFPGVRLGGGMFSYFTELNRKRPPVQHLDYVTHCTCPIVHDPDDRSVMQSLEALPFILRSTRAIIGAGTPYRIGPSTLGMRHNPYGSRTMPNPEGRRIPMTANDPRQRGLFAAAWMIGYAARLGEAGVEAFTGAALTGDFGLLDEDGRARPVFHAAKMLADIGGWARVACRSSDEDRVLALSGRSDLAERTVLLANLTARDQRVELPAGEIVMLDETAMDSPQPLKGKLTLRAYAVARVVLLDQ
ncbi:MAG TPA: hypothetical protein VIQ29_02845, partial [Ancylobacter sp.]